MLKLKIFGILTNNRRGMDKNFRLQKKPTLYEWLIAFIGNLFFYTCLVVALGLVIFSLFLVECEVTGPSMQPTFNKLSEKKHDIVYLNKFDNDYSYGDIVVLDRGDEAIIKRVIGLSGDVIDIVCTYPNGLTPIYKLELNGEVVDEDYILVKGSNTPTDLQNGMEEAYNRFQQLKQDHPEQFNAEEKLVVKDGQIFVLGDNRAVSSDSTSYGVFTLKQVSGKVERVRYYGVGQAEFCFEYIVKGEFLKTLFNAIF